MKLIHVNANIIKYNSKHGESLPACRVQVKSKSYYCREVKIKGPSTVVYRPNKPLPCGAKVWIETDAELELIEEIPYQKIKNEMNLFKDSEKD